MAIQILMIVPNWIDNAVLDKAHVHLLNFANNWGAQSVAVFGPNDSRIKVTGSTYKGVPRKSSIIAYLGTMNATERVIYIDDHSAIVNGEWVLENKTPDDPEYHLGHADFDVALGGKKAYLICRGNGSGESVTTSVIAKPNRNIFCSMHDNENIWPNDDKYDLSNAANPLQLETQHDQNANMLPRNPYPQTPQKYVGI